MRNGWPPTSRTRCRRPRWWWWPVVGPPQALTKAVGAAGVVDTTVGRAGPEPSGWPSTSRAAPSGSTVRRRPDCPSTWAATSGAWRACSTPWPPPMGPAPRSRSTELEPFLGEAGSLAPWDLTDAIDAGETARALSCSTGCWGRPTPTPGGAWPISTATTARSCGWTGPAVSAEEAAEMLGLRAPTRPRRRWPSRAGWGPSRSPGPSSSWPRPTWTPGRHGCPVRPCSRCWWPG